jgi:uridine phosphorylase
MIRVGVAHTTDEECITMEKKLFSAADIPLQEFDPDKTAVIGADYFVHRHDLPEYCVLPIYFSLIEKLKAENILEPIPDAELETFSLSVYKVVCNGKDVAVAYPRVGAPWATAMSELLIGSGCRKFVACGTAGVLRSDIRRGTVVIPDSALRDEGTSYHYYPPSRYIEMDVDVVKKLEIVLKKHDVVYQIGRTWTMDAFFRETKGKIEKRIAEGCLTVEMECSALIAAARMHEVKFGQYLEADDDVCGNKWDKRDLSPDVKMELREKLFWLSVEASLSL